MASTYLTNTFGTPTNQNIWTFSCWIKRSNDNVAETIFAPDIPNGSIYNQMLLRADGTLQWYGTDDAGGNSMNLTTNRVFGDINAWYHLVFAWDSTQGTASNRAKLYVNGVQETSFSTATYPVQNSTAVYTWNEASRLHSLGARRYTGSPTGYFSGSMSHVHFCDGTAYQASTFGETDSTTGEWKIKTGPTVTYGNNGFFLKMEDRTNLDLDSSGNAHTFTTVGNLTATYDNPSNNFCTMNPLDNYYLGGTFTNGNNTVGTSGGKEWATGTMGVSAGLWYYESETGQETAFDYNYIGIAHGPATSSNMSLGKRANDYALSSYNGKIYTNNAGNTYGDSWSGTGVILGVYIDLNANKLYFAKDGVIMNSGTGFDITAAASTTNSFYTPAVADDHSQYNTDWLCNFGNGYFGTTAVTSAVADAGGIGAFEYDPSDGGASSFDGVAKDFRAICTKNINTYG